MSFRDFLGYTLRLLFYFSLLLITIFIAGFVYVQSVIVPQLPDTNSIRDIRMQVPLRIYTQDKMALAEFGDERRTPVAYKDLPPLLVKAVLAAEDARFYEHIGVDLKGMMRALLHLVKTGEKAQGASTITMQVARNVFDEKIGKVKTFDRKFKEILTALQIEQELSKDEILELYLNKIFLGHRAYGMGAAAQVYYGQELKDLNLAQYAMLAGLPKAPSKYNPLSNTKRALIRRNYILKRMNELGFIDETAYLAARATPDTAKRYSFSHDFDAPYIAEMVRMYMQENYPNDTYTGGYKVYTTVNTRSQDAAQSALRRAVQEYDHRHGYRGAVGKVDLAKFTLTEAVVHAQVAEDDAPLTQEELWADALEDYPSYGDLQPALVLSVDNRAAQVFSKEGGAIRLEWEGLSWARRYINEMRQTNPPSRASEVLHPGDIVMIQPLEPEQPEETPATPEPVKNADQLAAAPMPEAQAGEVQPPVAEVAPPKPQKWRLTQIPEVAGALVSLDANNGAILALTGGFNYYLSTFNRVIQAKRQPGSNFKPFIYSTALENGYTPASLVNDAPMVFVTGTKVWKPENYGRKFQGPTRLREALALSKNLVSVRLMDGLGLDTVLDYVSRFGFNPNELPHNLTLSLGTPELTPLQIVTGFAVFANGGYRVEPYFIERIEDYTGKVIYQANPTVVCRDCDLPITPPLKPIEEPELAGLAALLAADAQEKKEKAEAQAAAQVQGAPDSPIFHPHPSEPLELEKNIPRYAPRVITAQNAWIMTSMLKSVVLEGTAQRAKKLGRNDLAGKTGTTNEQRDAWFTGFNSAIATTAWVGFDQPRSLGQTVMGRETGGSAALPMWMMYMQEALKDMPEQNLPMPADIVETRIDPDTGLLARRGQGNALVEYFYKDATPKRYKEKTQEQYLINIEQDAVAGATDQLF